MYLCLKIAIDMTMYSHSLKIMRTKLLTNNSTLHHIYLVKTSTKTHNMSLFLFKIFKGNMSPKPRCKRQASVQEFLKGGGDGNSKNPKGILNFFIL